MICHGLHVQQYYYRIDVAGIYQWYRQCVSCWYLQGQRKKANRIVHQTMMTVYITHQILRVFDAANLLPDEAMMSKIQPQWAYAMKAKETQVMCVNDAAKRRSV